jgi:hypothetical protein
MPAPWGRQFNTNEKFGMTKIRRMRVGRPKTGVQRYTLTMLPSLIAQIRKQMAKTETNNLSRWFTEAAREKLERDEQE